MKNPFDEICLKHLHNLDLPASATINDIKSSYKLLVKVWHPDRFSHDKSLQEHAQEKLKIINLSFDWLMTHYCDPSSPPAKDEKVVIHEQTENSNKTQQVKRINLRADIYLDLNWCPSGTFRMGSTKGNPSEQPIHDVHLNGFWISKYPITIQQYKWLKKNVVITNNERNFPAEFMYYSDCVEFTNQLNNICSKSYSGFFRLPTEAEWEFACRAGSSSEYCFGDDVRYLKDYSWYIESTREYLPAKSSGWFGGWRSKRKIPVGLKKPNLWGVHDMHGLVLEWCSDWFGQYSQLPQINPTGPSHGDYHVLRGGNFFADASDCRSSSRFYSSSACVLTQSIGLRVVYSEKQSEN